MNEVEDNRLEEFRQLKKETLIHHLILDRLTFLFFNTIFSRRLKPMAPEEALLDQFFIKKQPPAGRRAKDGRTSSFSWKITPIIQSQTNPFGFKLLGPITLTAPDQGP
jgi:hypothetical protein